MNILTHAAMMSMIPLVLANAAQAQSLRCIEEHLISEVALDERPNSYAMLDNGTLAVLHINPSPVIRFYDTSSDTLNCSANLNNDNVLDFYDVSAFLIQYQSGCP